MPTLAELRRQSILEDRQRKKNSWTYDYTPQQQPQEETGFFDGLGNTASYVVDNLAAGTGGSMETFGNFLESALRPEDKTPTEWHNQVGAPIKWLQNTGRDIKERNTHYYEPHSTEALIASGLQSLPEMGADMLASWGIGAAAGGPLGLVAATGKNLLSAGKWGKRIYDAYQGTSRAAQLARTLTPRSSTVAATGVGTTLEALSEGQRAADDYVARAKYDGTYVPNQTELEAENLRSRVFRDNVAAISGTNAAQYGLTFGNVGKGRTLRRLLGAMGLEGTEEYIQGIIPKVEQGQEWHYDDPDLIDSFIVGAGMGGVLHGAGRGVDYLANRNNPPPPQPQSDSIQDIFADAQSQANVDRYTPSDSYTGENGQAEGKYWERNPNMGVSFDGAQPELMNAIDKLAKYYYENTGKRLVINAGTNGSHADGEHSHAAGWKVDVVDAGGSDVSMSEDGPLFTAGYDKGPFLDEFIAYGRSIGLGMNLENLGTGNVHLDIALDGTQWDGNGENAGGFNPVNRGQVSEQNFEETADDPNFTEKQNEIWREAQYVASEAKKRFGYNIKPEWVYGQWSHEAGVNFDSKNARYNNNFGGLTQAEFNGEENKQPDGNNYYRTFKTPREYSEAYLNDFLRYYDGMKNVTNSDEFVQVLKDNDYFGEDLNVYKDAVREFSGKTPQTRMKNPSAPSSTSRTPSISLPTESTESDEYRDEAEEEFKPIKFSDDDELTQNIFDEFANGKRQDSEDKNLFADVFNQDNNFINTQENRDAVQKDFGEEFDKFLQSKGYKLASDETAPKIKSQLQQPQEQPKPQQGQVEFERIKSPEKKYLGSEFEKSGTVEKIRAIRDWASESGNVKLMSDASTIENSDNKQAQEKFVRDNPLPKEYIQRWEKENAEDTEETSETSTLETPAQEKSTAEAKKSKVEIPAKLLEIARAKVDMDNSNARIRQGEALLEIAKLNKFEVDKTLERTAKNGYKKAVPQLKALLEEQGFLNDGKEGTETTADKHKKIRSEYEAKQKELDEAYRAVQEIPADTIDIIAIFKNSISSPNAETSLDSLKLQF